MIEYYTNRDVTHWLRLMADLEHAADPEFPGAEPAVDAALLLPARRDGSAASSSIPGDEGARSELPSILRRQAGG